MKTREWMRGNLTTQGYCLPDAERRALWLGLRFSTGTCLALAATAVSVQSVAFLAVLVAVGAVAGFTSRHPFDHIWNHAVRHIVGGPAVPPNPRRRRDAFKIATVWLAAVAVLFATGQAAAASVLGGLLIAACATVTLTNLCLPSEAFALWGRLRDRKELRSA